MKRALLALALLGASCAKPSAIETPCFMLPQGQRLPGVVYPLGEGLHCRDPQIVNVLVTP